MGIDSLKNELARRGERGIDIPTAGVERINYEAEKVRAGLSTKVCVDYAEQPIEYQSLRGVLAEVEEELPSLLLDRDSWGGVVIDSMPVVYRLYREWNEDFRIFLHRIEPDPQRKLPVLHYHPSPSVMKIHSGGYKQFYGYGPPGGPTPPICASVDIREGAVHEMIDPNLWHAITLEETSWSTMVSPRRSWQMMLPNTPHTRSLRFPQIGISERESMFQRFEQWYPLPKPIKPR